MKILLTIVFGLLSFADLTSAKDLTDVSYSFDSTKIAEVSSPSNLLTNFVDYFYLLIAQNKSNLATVSLSAPYAGWCVGDAHLENFGALIQEDGRPVFSMNDMDDSGPCPVAFDLYRLMVSARLNDGEMNLAELLSAYGAGLVGSSRLAPPVVEQLLKKSLQRGAKVDMKKVDATTMRFVRADDTQELSQSERDLVATAIASVSPLSSGQILDVLRRLKTSGGSGGLLRYEVLLQMGSDLLHIEFKEQVRPSIYPIASSAIPAIGDRIARSLQFTQGGTASRFYQTTSMNGTDMLIRPRFAGNVAVKTSSLGGAELYELAQYQAYTLGRIHSRSVNKNWLTAFQKINLDMWTQDVEAMVAQFNKKFDELKSTPH